MGCGASKDRLQTVDDSVHVSISLDKKRQKMKGTAPHGYVPRAERPILHSKAPNVTDEEEGEDNEKQPAESTSTSAVAQ
jgi:hypothetical protein